MLNRPKQSQAQNGSTVFKNLTGGTARTADLFKIGKQLLTIGTHKTRKSGSISTRAHTLLLKSQKRIKA